MLALFCIHFCPVILRFLCESKEAFDDTKGVNMTFFALHRLSMLLPLPEIRVPKTSDIMHPCYTSGMNMAEKTINKSSKDTSGINMAEKTILNLLCK